MNYNGRKVKGYLSILIVFSLTSFHALLASEINGDDEKQVTNVLEIYRKAIDQSSFRIMAECLAPPVDKLNISNENMQQAFNEFADYYDKAWGKELLPGVDLTFFRTHPLSYLSNYKYSNIIINGNSATADIVLIVNGKAEKSVQRLAKINQKWYVVQKDGPPDYNEKDKNRILSLSGLVQELADFVKNINKKIALGIITQEECIRLVREKVTEFEKKRVEILN